MKTVFFPVSEIVGKKVTAIETRSREKDCVKLVFEDGLILEVSAPRHGSGTSRPGYLDWFVFRKVAEEDMEHVGHVWERDGAAT